MKKDKPHEGILHRELHIHDVGEHYQPQLDVLREVVDYGTNLIAAAFYSSNKQLGDVIVVPVLFKQVVSMLDAFEVLVSSACVPAAQLQSRAMFEASVYIDFILLGNEEEKARFFYVSNLRRELTWALRSQKGSAEHARFFAALGEFGDALQESQKATAEPAQKQVQEIQTFLSKEPWKSANAALEQAKGKKKYDVAWHVPFGKGSIRELSQLTGRLHEYEVFYSASSEKMHASDYKSHISIKSGYVAFEPIRNLEGIHSLLNFALSVAFHTYQKILERYRPGQINEFARRYAENWRAAYLNIPKVVYNSSHKASL